VVTVNEADVFASNVSDATIADLGD